MYAISLGDGGAELRPLEPWHAEEFLAHLERGREFIGQFISFGSKATDVESARGSSSATPTCAPPTARPCTASGWTASSSAGSSS